MQRRKIEVKDVTVDERQRPRARQGGRTGSNGLVMWLFIAVLVVGTAIVFASSIFVVHSSSSRPAQGTVPGTASRTPPIKERPPAVRRAEDGQPAKAKRMDAKHDDTEYHIVFSTGCSIFQDWQSYVFFYQALVMEQPGTVTRIVSGCSELDEVKLRKVFDEQIVPMSQRFRIHFTPDYSKPRPNMPAYHYFNKPFGMRHWLQNALGFPSKPANEDAIVILMDPDQLILRPFVGNNFSNTEWQFVKPPQVPYTRIEHGKPMGQMYAFGLQWMEKINMTKLVPNEKSPVSTMSKEEAKVGYMLGPPYAATARDMYQIVVRWCDFGLPVYDQYPYLLAEMFAYCLAAAHLRLSHQTAASFMVSDVDAGGEGWSYVDKLAPAEVCRPKSIEQLPNVLHFCQRYAYSKFFIAKRRLPEDFLTCQSPLLTEVPPDLISNHAYHWDTGRKNYSLVRAQRHKFMTCHLIGGLNRAADHFKRHHCDASVANFNKSLRLLTDAMAVEW